LYLIFTLMKKTLCHSLWLFLSALLGLCILLSLTACQSRTTAGDPAVAPSSPTVAPPQRVATPSLLPAATAQVTSLPTTLKPYQLFQQYTIHIPDDVQIKPVGPNAAVAHTVYLMTAPNGETATVIQHPFLMEDGAKPAPCGLVDRANQSSYIECDGMVLTQTEQLTPNFLLAFGSRSIDLAYGCTMNSPCPLDIPPESRYASDYVFVVTDDRRTTLLEWFISAAHAGVDDKRGIVAIVRNTVLPSLTR
jgi:hypothetical protein